MKLISVWRAACTLCVGSVVLHAPSVACQSVTLDINPGMSASEINSSILSHSSAHLTVQMLQNCSSLQPSPYTYAQLLAMFPKEKRTNIHYVGGIDECGPPVVKCDQSALLDLDTMLNFSISSVTFRNCWIRIGHAWTEDTKPFFNDVLFEDAGLYLGNPQLLDSELLVLQTVRFENVEHAFPGFRSALEIRVGRDNFENRSSITVSRATFSSISALTAMLVTNDANSSHQLDLRLLDCHFKDNTFGESNVTDLSNSTMAVALAVEARSPRSLTNVFLDNCKAEGNGNDGPEADLMAVMDFREFTNNADLCVTVQRNSEFRRNKQTPLRVTGAKKVVVDYVTIDGNAPSVLASASEIDMVASAGLAVLVSDQQEETEVSITNSCFHNNVITSSSDESHTSGGGAIQFIAHNAIYPKLSIENCTFDGNKVERPDTAGSVENFLLYHGGALSMWLTGTTENASIHIHNCNFTMNQALFGGGMALTITDDSANNSIWITCSADKNRGTATDCGFFWNNGTGVSSSQTPLTNGDRAGKGGGLAVQFHGNAHSNMVWVLGLKFNDNGASAGGGFHAGFYDYESFSSLTIDNCTFTRNKAIIGAGLALWGGGSYLTWDQRNGGSRYITTSNLNFIANEAFFSGAMAVTFLEFTMSGSFCFHQNYNSALYLRASLCNFQASALYSNNVAHVGAAVFSLSSTMRLFSGSSSVFKGNIAMAIGGAYYAYDEVRSLLSSSSRHSTRCFLVHQNYSSPVTDWDIHVNFTDNLAGLSGPAVYVDNIDPCAWMDPLRLLKWLRADAGQNFIVSSLFDGVATRSVFLASPGGSLQTLAYPTNHFWDDSLIIKLREDADERNLSQYVNSSDSRPGSVIGTDVIFLEFFHVKHFSELKLNLNRSNICEVIIAFFSKKRAEEPGYQTTVEVIPGMVTELSAVACDQFNNSVDARLFLATTRPNQCDKVSQNSAASNAELRNVTNGLHVVHTHPQLIASRQVVSDMLFSSRTLDRSDGETQVTVSVVGASNLVSTQINVAFKPCAPGYVFPRPQDRQNDECHYDCICMRDANTEDTEEVDFRVLACRKTSLYLTAGSWAHNTFKNGTDGKLGNYILDIHQCPPGYCKCDAEDERSCQYNSSQENDQCLDGRTGFMCGTCPGKEPTAVGFFHGSCVKKSECRKFKKYLLPFTVFLIVPVAVAGTLFLQVPLSNDLRGPLFYFFTLPMVFYNNDVFLLKLSALSDQPSRLLDKYCNKGRGYFSNLGWVLSALSFSKSSDCLYGGETTLDVVQMGYVLPLSMFFWMLVFFLLHRCCAGRYRCYRLNLNYGAELLLLLAFQRLLVTTAFIVRFESFKNVVHEMRYYYDANIVYLGHEHRCAFAVAMVTTSLMLFIIVNLCVLSRKACHGCFWYRCFETLIDSAVDAMLFGLRQVPELDEGRLSDWRLKRWWQKFQYTCSPTRYWPAWEMLRRTVVVAVYIAPFDKEIWAKHRMIMLILFLLVVVNALCRPYDNVNVANRYQRLVNQPEGHVEPFRRSPKFLLSMPFLRNGITCNGMEIVLLLNLCFVCLFSNTSGQPDLAGSAVACVRLVIISIAVCWPLVWLLALVCHKVWVLIQILRGRAG